MSLKNLLFWTFCFVVHSSFAVTRYVTALGSGSMNGTSWSNAFPGSSLQTVINTSAPGDEIWIACGTYFPTVSTDRAVSFSMRNGVSIYGGFQGIESTLQSRNLSCGPCSVFSGNIGAAGSSDNSYNVVRNSNLNSTAIL